MITITGDQIYYCGEPVAVIIVPQGTLREAFCEHVTTEPEDTAELYEEMNQLEEKLLAISKIVA